MSGAADRDSARGLGTAWIIATREFTTRIRSRTFTLTTALFIVGIAGYILLQAYVLNKPSSLHVAFAGDAQAIAAPFEAAAARLGVTIHGDLVDDVAQARSAVRAGNLDALVTGPPSATRVIVKTTGDPTLESALEGVIRQKVLDTLLTERGIDPTDVERQVAATTVHVDALSPLDAARIQEVVVGLFVAGTLYIMLVIYGQIVAAGVVEEKSNRIVEVLLTAVRPWELLAGKIAGIGLVGVVQMAAAGAVAVVLASITKLVAIPTLGVDVIAGGFVWFVLGYLFYAIVAAGAASLVSRQEDVAAVITPINLLIVAAWLIALTVAAPDPGGNLTAVLSLVPPLAPVLMPVRIAAGEAPLWQVLLSVVLSLGAIWLMTAAAGRIYRNSVLRVGPRVKLGDALRGS